MIESGAKGRVQKAFDHGKGRLDLPSLAIRFLREPLKEFPTIVSAEAARLSVMSGAPPTRDGKDASNADLLVTKPMPRLAVVAGVAQERGHPLTARRAADRRLEFAVIGSRPPAEDRPQDQMALRVTNGRKLGKTGLPVGVVSLAALGEIMRNVSGFQAGRVNGGQTALPRQDSFAPTVPQNQAHQPVRVGLLEQPPAGRTEGREVRHPLEPKSLSQVGPLAQQAMEAAIVEPMEFLNHQAGHQLRLTELVRTLGTGVRGVTALCNPKGRSRQGQDALRGLHEP